MNYTDTQGLITGGVTSFGLSAFTILTAVIGIGLAFLVFRFGWAKIKYLNGYDSDTGLNWKKEGFKSKKAMYKAMDDDNKDRL